MLSSLDSPGRQGISQRMGLRLREAQHLLKVTQVMGAESGFNSELSDPLESQSSATRLWGPPPEKAYTLTTYFCFILGGSQTF